MARSSNDVPDAMRLRAACASPSLGNTICDTSRFSGVPSLSRFCSKIFFASSSETSVHLPISSGLITTKDDLPIFGRAELGLVVLEIGGQRLGRGRIDRAGLRGVELDEFDRALLVLETGQRIDQHLRRLDPGGDGAGDLTPQPDAALLGEIALFGVAELPDRGLEASGIECAAQYP